VLADILQNVKRSEFKDCHLASYKVRACNLLVHQCMQLVSSCFIYYRAITYIFISFCSQYSHRLYAYLTCIRYLGVVTIANLILWSSVKCDFKLPYKSEQVRL